MLAVIVTRDAFICWLVYLFKCLVFVFLLCWSKLSVSICVFFVILDYKVRLINPIIISNPILYDIGQLAVFKSIKHGGAIAYDIYY